MNERLWENRAGLASPHPPLIPRVRVMSAAGAPSEPLVKKPKVDETTEYPFNLKKATVSYLTHLDEEEDSYARLPDKSPADIGRPSSFSANHAS